LKITASTDEPFARLNGFAAAAEPPDAALDAALEPALEAALEAALLAALLAAVVAAELAADEAALVAAEVAAVVPLPLPLPAHAASALPNGTSAAAASAPRSNVRRFNWGLMPEFWGS
jgi:hypothetical protein